MKYFLINFLILFLVISIAASSVNGLFVTGSGDMKARIWRISSQKYESSMQSMTDIIASGDIVPQLNSNIPTTMT